MKKILSMFLILALSCSLCISTGAVFFDGVEYTMDIPEEYQQVSLDTFEADDGSNFTISYEDNTEIGFCVKDMSKKDVQEYAELIVQEGTGAISILSADCKIELVSAEKIEHSSGKSALVIVLKTTMIKDGKTLIHYQKMYQFAGQKQKYTFIFTPKNEKDIDSLDKTFDSLKIVEPEATGKTGLLEEGLLLGVLVLFIILGIVRFIRKSDSDKKPNKPKKKKVKSNV